MLTNIACEDVDLEGEEAGSVEGFWERNRNSSGSNTFLLVSETEVIFYFYDSSENCLTIDAYDIVRVDGSGFYILTKEGLEQNRVIALTRDGDSIYFRDIVEDAETFLQKFFLSQVDINTLAPICVNLSNVFVE
tara:strand:- start:49113 stop:49514 length:402 start_codon:yes stop_codon:yes gene_type:complete